MPIKVGDKIPSVIIKHMTPNGMRDLWTGSVFANKHVVMFGLPGAFTPTCSAKHLPGYVTYLDAFRSRGIEIACLSVNDPFVMQAWQEQNKAEGITMLADGNGTFTETLGLEMDGTAHGLGYRCLRFALSAEDGVVKYLGIEKPGKFEVSSAEAMLGAIDMMRTAAA